MLAAVNGRSSLITRWEDLHLGVQMAASFVVALIVLTFVHWAFLNQPMGRAFWYGVFWGAIAAVVIVLATRAERARRLGRDSR